MELETIANQIDGDTSEGVDLDKPATLENLSDLIGADTPADKTSEDGNEGAASGNVKKDAKPTMFNDLAGSLGIELDDLYKLKVSTVDGKTVTIEELKALQGTQDDIAIRELEFEETRTVKEGDLRQSQNELAEIIASLPNDTLKPEILEKLRAKNATRTQVEQSRTMEAIPTWSDETKRTADLAGMATHLEKFGFPANHLGTVIDHRMFVFIRESHLREQRIQKALAKVRAGKPNPTTSTKTTGKTKQVKPANPNARNGLENFFLNA